MRVLVVEDDRSVRETIAVVLAAYSHEAELAEGGSRALSILEEMTAKSQWPDVMLLDLKLDGETGEEVYESIRRRFGQVPPTVVISALIEAAERVGRMPPGTRLLSKPYTVDELLSLLEQARLSGVPSSKTA